MCTAYDNVTIRFTACTACDNLTICLTACNLTFRLTACNLTFRLTACTALPTYLPPGHQLIVNETAWAPVHGRWVGHCGVG